MNKDIAAGKMKQAEGFIQEKWGKLTKQDFERIKGDKEKLVGLIQEKYGEAKEKIEETLSEILGNSSLQETVHDTVDAAYQKKDEVVDCAQQICGDLSEKIKQNPIASILIGVGLGFLLGKIMK